MLYRRSCRRVFRMWTRPRSSTLMKNTVHTMCETRRRSKCACLVLATNQGHWKAACMRKESTYSLNTFKYHVSCTDWKIPVRIIYFYYLFFHRRPAHKLCFLSCTLFVVNATFSTAQARRQKKLQDLLKMLH